MGVYIKGMEMPENCALCPVWDAGNCLVAAEAIICEYTKRPSDCPIVPVPPHGRLIDADALANKHRTMAYEDGGRKYSFHASAKAWVEDAPTIIPAEEGE